MRQLLAASLLAALLISAPKFRTGLAQQDPFTTKEKIIFGESIAIEGTLITSETVQKIDIFAHEAGSPTTYTRPVKASRVKDGSYQLEHVINIADLPLRAFAELEYRLEATTESGEVITSQPRKVIYEDNRFPWKTLEEPPFRLHWYEGSTQFAQELLDIGQKGLLRSQTMIGFVPPGRMDIYVYPDSTALQDTLSQSNRSWIAGHADPDLGLIVISLPAGPEQQLLAEQRIPHELMHVLLYRALGSDYALLPVWLSEGLASSAELYPNPDYEILEDDAADNAQLIPMSYLCSSFPKDASSALLAYAQSTSFTRFILDNYGADGISNLISQYTQGLSCEQGANIAVGKSLSRLESAWQKERFGMTVTESAWLRLVPWLVILAAVILPILLVAFFVPRWRKR